MPTMAANVDSVKELGSGKRHSINVVGATEGRQFNFLESAFLSTLLSESDAQDDGVKEVDALSDDVDRLLREDVRASTEIVYKFCGGVDEDDIVASENRFLPEPALYRLEPSNFAGISPTRPTASEAAFSSNGFNGFESSSDSSVVDSDKNSEIFI